MFLLAKLILTNLYHQTRVHELEAELEKGKIPKEINKAYGPTSALASPWVNDVAGIRESYREYSAKHQQQRSIQLGGFSAGSSVPSVR